jgi:hypothetical protein
LIESDSGWLPLSFDSLTAICTGKTQKQISTVNIRCSFFVFT